MPFSAGTASKTAKFTIMNSYTLDKEEHEKVPDDATNVRLTRNIDGDKVITFQSDTGPVEENADNCGCPQCDAEQEATPDSLMPRKTPWGDN